MIFDIALGGMFFLFVFFFFKEEKKKTLPELAKSVTFSISEILVVWEFFLNVSFLLLFLHFCTLSYLNHRICF